MSQNKVKEIVLLPPIEVPIDEEILEEFEESGMSPLEALKKTKGDKKTDKPIISIDQQLNENLKLPSEEKKNKKKNDSTDSDTQITLDF